MRRAFGFIVHHPRTIIAIVLLITLYFGYGFSRVTKDDSVDKMLPDGDPVLEYTRQMEEIFASDEFLLVAVEHPQPFNAETVAKLLAMADTLRDIPGVRKVFGPTNTKNVSGAEGEMSSEPLVDIRHPPATPAELNAYREAITGKALFRGSIISEHENAFGFLLRLEKNPNKKRIVSEVQSIVDRYQLPETIYFSGSPAINLQVGKYMAKDMAKYLPMVLALILLTLWFNFRSLRGIWLPFVAILIPVVWTIGFQGWIGVPISVIGTMIPTLVVAVGVSYGVHVLTDYYEQAPGRSEQESAIVDTMVSIGPTIGLAGITAVIGFSSLAANDTPILREFGWITAFGILCAMIVSLTFIPACLALMNPPAEAIRKEIAGRLISRLVATIVRFNGQHHRAALAVSGLLVAVSISGYGRLHIETNAINFFREDDPVRRTIGKVSSEFGGTITIRTIIESPDPDTILSPEYLRQVDAYQRFLEGFPRVGKTLSIGDLLKDMNMALHEGDPNFFRLPDTLEQAEQYLFLYMLSSQPDDFESFIDSAHSRLTVTARLRQVNDRNEALGTRETEHILRDIERYISANFSSELKVTPTGRAQDIVRTSNYIVKGLVRSMLTAVIPIYILVSLVFRSPLAGLFGITTTAVGLILNFGVMGWFGIPLDIATTLISSVAIGIGVDDAVHYLIRLRRAAARGVIDSGQAMVAALSETGPAIIATSLTMVLGFSIFMVASFKPVAFFGGLTALSMLTTSVAALLVVPVSLAYIRPKFVSRRYSLPSGISCRQP